MTRQMAMNCSTTRQRITLWLVFTLRPDTMAHQKVSRFASVDNRSGHEQEEPVEIMISL